MGDFSQNGIVANLHDFSIRSTEQIEKDLLKFSKERKLELILPCLYSEIEGDALLNIVNEISKTKYINHVIIWLDQTNKPKTKKELKLLKNLMCL